MIYQELLDFLASNYLSRTEALNLVNQSVADMAKSNFDLLNQTVSNLAGQNATYFGCIVTIFAIFIGVPIFWERKKTKDILKNMEVLKNNMQKQEEGIKDMKLNFQVSQLDFENANLKNEEKLAKMGEKLKKDLLKQAVDSQYKLYLSINPQKKHDLIFFSYIGYLRREHEFYEKYGSFAYNSFSIFLIEMRNILSYFKKDDILFQDNMNVLLKEIFEKFAKIDEFEEESLAIIKESEELSSQPQINFPPGKPKV